MHEAISSNCEVEKMASERQNQKFLPKIGAIPPYPRRDSESETLQNESIKVGKSDHRLFPVRMHVPSEANRDTAFRHFEESRNVNQTLPDATNRWADMLLFRLVRTCDVGFPRSTVMRGRL